MNFAVTVRKPQNLYTYAARCSEHFITVSGQLLLHWDNGADNGEKYTPEHLRDEHGGDVVMESKDPFPVLEAASEEM